MMAKDDGFTAFFCIFAPNINNMKVRTINEK